MAYPLARLHRQATGVHRRRLGSHQRQTSCPFQCGARKPVKLSARPQSIYRHGIMYEAATIPRLKQTMSPAYRFLGCAQDLAQARTPEPVLMAH